MADIGFFQTPPDPAVDPSGFKSQQEMAAALMRRSATPAQGTNVSGHYVAPPAAGYVQQLANALASGYKMNQVRDASRASDILNGGSGEAGMAPLQKAGNWLGGLFGGGS